MAVCGLRACLGQDSTSLFVPPSVNDHPSVGHAATDSVQSSLGDGFCCSIDGRGPDPVDVVGPGFGRVQLVPQRLTDQQPAGIDQVSAHRGGRRVGLSGQDGVDDGRVLGVDVGDRPRSAVEAPSRRVVSRRPLTMSRAR
jgi:hypothetical protein